MRRYIPSKYEISKNRFAELSAFCRQYSEFQKSLNRCYGVKVKAIDGEQGSGGKLSSVEHTADQTESLRDKIDLIESTMKKVCEGAEGLYPYMMKCVTEGVSWEYNTGVPCGRSTYYLLRRKFFYELSKRR